jgi:phage gp45-like
MQRNSLVDVSGRSMLQAVRMKLGSGMKINDNPMMQELDFGGMISEGRKLVERIQGFGNTSVPLPPIAKKALAAAGGGAQGKSGPQAGTFAAGGGGGGGGGAGGGEAGGGQEEAPEGIAVFLGGQRNHPVVVGVDDRRHRPMGMKPGESAQYDDIGQMTLLRRNGTYLLSTDSEDQDGKKEERMVSLRHVEKKKQERKPQVPQKSRFQLQAMSVRERKVYAQQLAQQAKDDQAKQDHKHEGDTVNTELRVTKKKIEFRNGDEVVADHEKSSNKWNFKGKEHHVTSSDKHTVTSQQVGINGSTVGINGAVSVNGSPVATTATLAPHFHLVAALVARIEALEARLGP